MAEEKKEDEKTDEQKEADKEPDRLLKGVMRVGLLSEGLLLKGDTEVRFVTNLIEITKIEIITSISGASRGAVLADSDSASARGSGQTHARALSGKYTNRHAYAN